jgi:hypothetical protein
MIRRVTWPSHKDYPNYGGRGITVDPSWLVFSNFFQDMGERPDGTTLERNDVNGPYNKNNCKWATFTEQNFNRRPHKKTTTGLVGVTIVNHGKAFRAYGKLRGLTNELYRGSDFFEAVCRRKSWENKNAK